MTGTGGIIDLILRALRVSAHQKRRVDCISQGNGSGPVASQVRYNNRLNINRTDTRQKACATQGDIYNVIVESVSRGSVEENYRGMRAVCNRFNPIFHDGDGFGIVCHDRSLRCWKLQDGRWVELSLAGVSA